MKALYMLHRGWPTNFPPVYNPPPAPTGTAGKEPIFAWRFSFQNKQATQGPLLLRCNTYNLAVLDQPASYG